MNVEYNWIKNNNKNFTNLQGHSLTDSLILSETLSSENLTEGLVEDQPNRIYITVRSTNLIEMIATLANNHYSMVQPTTLLRVFKNMDIEPEEHQALVFIRHP